MTSSPFCRTFDTLSPGVQIPPLRTLCTQFAVSPFTLRTALKRLEADGYLSCERGRGTFVLDRRKQRSGPLMVALLLIDISPEINYDYRAIIDDVERFLSLEKRVPFSWASLTSADIVRGRFPAVLEAGLCHGVVLDGHITEAHLVLRERFGVDIVVAGNHDLPRSVPQVRIRIEPAVREVAERLGRACGRRVLLAVEPLRNAVTREIIAGYSAALTELEQADELLYLCQGDQPPPTLIRELTGPEPPAVITTARILPRIEADCRAAGIDPARIPTGVVKSSRMEAAPNRPLYQVVFNPHTYMRLAAERLVELMQGQRETVFEDLPLEIVAPDSPECRGSE